MLPLDTLKETVKKINSRTHIGINIRKKSEKGLVSIIFKEPSELSTVGCWYLQVLHLWIRPTTGGKYWNIGILKILLMTVLCAWAGWLHL